MQILNVIIKVHFCNEENYKETIFFFSDYKKSSTKNKFVGVNPRCELNMFLVYDFCCNFKLLKNKKKCRFFMSTI